MMNGTLLLALLPETYEGVEAVTGGPNTDAVCVEGVYHKKSMCLPGYAYSEC
jgi:hypothetical protein